MAKTAKHFDDKRALAYDVLIRRIVPGYESLHGLARLLLVQALPDQAHVLVAGAGTGMELASLAKACPNWRFTAVDPSQAMLAVARHRAEEAGLADRIIFHAGFVHDLPEESVFDAATLLLVMHFVADDGGKAQLLASIARRLRPQAPLLLADLNADAGNERYQSFIRAWRAWQIDA
ncbi:MAG: class I SAM-dependent methyltransferase, partial [Rhodospirillales bacterium]|nr:class I SAM-dependent methyltransferase [Rhodospirillales bacterium]